MEILQFIIKNWYLFAALAVVIGMLLADPIGHLIHRVASVTPSEAVLLINRRDGVVLDLRNADQFRNGHIVGALNVPLSDLSQRVAELIKYKSRPLILSCDAGQSALKAATLLRSNGFETVNVLSGGIAAWESSQLPLEK